MPHYKNIDINGRLIIEFKVSVNFLDYIQLWICFQQVKFPEKNFLTKDSQFRRLESLLPARPSHDNITDDVDEVRMTPSLVGQAHMCNSTDFVLAFKLFLASSVSVWKY